MRSWKLVTEIVYHLSIFYMLWWVISEADDYVETDLFLVYIIYVK